MNIKKQRINNRNTKTVRIDLVNYATKTSTTVNDPKYKDRSRKGENCFTRIRKMPFPHLILHVLTAQKKSVQNALEDFFGKIGDVTYMSKQSFSEARHNLTVGAFIELFVMTAKLAYEGYYDTWHGYRLMAIDGIDLALPMNSKLLEHYGSVGRGNTSSTARGSILYDLLNKVVMDAQISPIACYERSLAVKHLEALKEVGQFKKELIILDRGYASFGLIETFNKQSVHFLMRVRTKFNSEIDAQTSADSSVLLKDGKGNTMNVRVVKFQLPSGETETLITNILDKRMGIKAFKELYFKRWNIEIKYDEVKNKLEIENFTGRSVLAIEQDFYATMYLTNIAAVACWEAQTIADKESKDKDNAYDYHINTNYAVGVLKDRFIKVLLEEDEDKRTKKITKIIFLLAKSVSIVRPNRKINRKPTTRKAKFHHNKKSNA